MTQSSLHAPFPAVSFISQAEFVEYCRAAQPLLDARYLFESGLIGQEDELLRLGTCAPCLRRATFSTDTASWERMADRRRIPRWPEAMRCDCADRLSAQSRALLHFAQAKAGLRDWTRLLLLGPEAPQDQRLAAEAGQATRLRRLVRGATDGAWRLEADTGRFHLAIAADYLHRVPKLALALGELRRVLAPGGSLMLTLPLRTRAARTVSRPQPDVAESREVVHEIGWDALDMLRAAGFSRAAAHMYWSNELGYLGAYNMILHAHV